MRRRYDPYVQRFLSVCPLRASPRQLRRIASIFAMNGFDSLSELRGAEPCDLLGHAGLSEEEQGILRDMLQNAANKACTRPSFASPRALRPISGEGDAPCGGRRDAPARRR